jgi:hypothetical protein
MPDWTGVPSSPLQGEGSRDAKVLCTTQRIDKLYESTAYALANIRVRAERSVVSGSAGIEALRHAT